MFWEILEKIAKEIVSVQDINEKQVLAILRNHFSFDIKNNKDTFVNTINVEKLMGEIQK